MKELKLQLKGAGKLFFLLNLTMFALNLWIMKDDRHVSILTADRTCQVAQAETALPW